MNAICILIIIPMTFLGGLNCQTPGYSDVETVLTSSGFKFIAKTFADSIHNLSAAVPAKREEIRYISKTGLEAQLSDLSVHKVIIPSPELSVAPNEGLKVSFSNISFQVDFGWKNVFQAGKRDSLADSGKFQITAAQVQVDLLITITESTTTLSCSARINKLSLLSGDMVFYLSVVSSIRSGLVDEICAIAMKTLEISKIKNIINIAAGFEKVAHHPVFRTRYEFGSDFIKTYTNISQRSISQAKPMNVPTDKMLGLSVSENAIDEVLKTCEWTSGSHHYILKVWEELSDIFDLGWQAKDGPFTIALHFRSPATSSISSEGISLNILGNATFESLFVSNVPSKSLHLAFNSTLHLDVKLSSDGSKVEIVLKKLEVSSVPKNSINFDLINKWMEPIVQEKMKGLVFEGEVPLVSGLVLTNPKMTLKSGYLTISSDLGWTASG